ncbi:hypothetical protein EVAR_75953_1 [Eumeta japonica]|uniref:Uncharacterized protein n=1 Tax=Eumeta variegata TaxID=151549 RepID=A0A4C1UWS9_EUMVA|nr:hypothetical protein EVAR_75953_1 [Eumeta japonica]
MPSARDCPMDATRWASPHTKSRGDSARAELLVGFGRCSLVFIADTKSWIRSARETQDVNSANLHGFNTKTLTSTPLLVYLATTRQRPFVVHLVGAFVLVRRHLAAAIPYPR